MGESGKAIDTAEITIQDADQGADDESRANAGFVLAGLEFRLGKNERAREHLATALSALSRVSETSQTRIRRLELLVVSALAGGDYPAARKHSAELMNYAQQEQPSSGVSGAKAKLRHQQVLRRSGAISEAAAVLDSAMATLESELGPLHPEFMKALAERAQLRLHQNQFELAIADAQRALEWITSQLGADHPRAGLAHHVLAASMSSLGRLSEEVLPHFQRAFAIIEKAHGPKAPALIAIRAEQASYLAGQGQLAAADGLYAWAVHLQEELSGPKYPALAGLLASWGENRMRLGDAKQAERLLQRAVSLEAASGSTHTENEWGFRFALARVQMHLNVWPQARKDLEYFAKNPQLFREHVVPLVYLTLAEALVQHPPYEPQRALALAAQGRDLFGALKLNAARAEAESLILQIQSGRTFHRKN